MWSKLSQRLSDPLFYRKRWLQLVRPFHPPRAPRPVTLDALLENAGPVFAVFAHPDDELFASCLLCELSSRGKPFHLVCLTRGEGGITGGTTRDELGAIREAELRASAEALGAASVTFLGHIDPLGLPHRTFAPDVSVADLAKQLRGLLGKHDPSVIVTHGSGGEYWHPAHLLVHRAVFLASQGKHDVLTIHAWQDGHALPGMLNRDDPADLIVDGTPHRAKRLAAFRAHASQHDYFAGHGGSLERYVDLSVKETFRHYQSSDSTLTR